MRPNRIKSTKTGLLCILLLVSFLPWTVLASHQSPSHSNGVSSEIENLEERRLEEKLVSNVAVSKKRFLSESDTNSARAVGEDGNDEAGEKLAPAGDNPGGDDENKEKAAGGTQENDNPQGKDSKPENGESEGGQSTSGGNEDDKSEGGGDTNKPGDEGDKQNKPEDGNANEKQGEGQKSGGDGKLPGGNEGENSEHKTDPCKDAPTCKDCQEAAKGITEGDKTCWWIEVVCQHVDKEEQSVDSMCEVPTPAPSPAPQKKAEPTPEGKKPEPPPTEKKDSDTTPAPTVPSTPSSQGDDDSAGPNYSFYFGILFLVAVAAFLVKYGKRFMQAIPSEARYGSRAQYQGVYV